MAWILLEASILLTWIIGCASKCSLLAVFLIRRDWNLFFEHWNERELWPGKTGNETPEIFSVNILFLRWFLPLESIAKYLLLWNTLIHFCSYITLYFHVQNKWLREVGGGGWVQGKTFLSTSATFMRTKRRLPPGISYTVRAFPSSSFLPFVTFSAFLG